MLEASSQGSAAIVSLNSLPANYHMNLKTPTNPFAVFRNLEIVTGKQSNLSCPRGLGWIWCKVTPAALQHP